jgi:hypothetical protein
MPAGWPLAWDRGRVLTYALNSLGAMASSAVSVIFFQDRAHDAAEILAGTGFLVGVAWFISYVIAGPPLHRPPPGTQDVETADVVVPATAVQPGLALSR